MTFKTKLEAQEYALADNKYLLHELISKIWDSAEKTGYEKGYEMAKKLVNIYGKQNKLNG